MVGVLIARLVDVSSIISHCLIQEFCTKRGMLAQTMKNPPPLAANKFLQLDL
jgi:hypothetical protein